MTNFYLTAAAPLRHLPFTRFNSLPVTPEAGARRRQIQA